VNYGGNLFNTQLYTRSQGDISMSDYLTMRGRLGLGRSEIFCPIWSPGVAFGQTTARESRGRLQRRVRQSCASADPTCPIVNGQNQMIGAIILHQSHHGKYQLGFDAAVGMDYMVTRYVFVRGELENMNFQYPNDIG